MEFNLLDSSLFISIFDNIKSYSDNVTMKLQKNKMHIQSIDDANISIIDAHINKAYFHSYNMYKDTALNFTVSDICKILKMCSKSRFMNFKIKDNIIIITSVSPDGINKQFEINSNVVKNTDFINIENIQSISFTSVDINSRTLYSIFSELNTFTEDILLKLNKDGVHFYGNNDAINMKYNIDIESELEKDIISKYSLNYLAKYKLLNVFDNSTLKFSSNNPILIVNENDNIKTNFVLSPKIIDD